ncbi:hypothetical protein PsYK624_145330 [Phanerochaete sordida]|uniref:Uncharacterized protein n=1 Tax=Phanerochaete sordida TaxID=48140 RepID=A0A9P3LKA1_9APHY|nr:hypothetical protein PsYK624_145330 [Phanerochaete sordida]
MHDVVRPVRYHSVSLVEKRKLFAFASLLKTLDDPPILRHLFVGLDGYSLPPDDASLTIELWEEWDIQIRGSATKVHNALRTILASAAPNLRTLVIHGWRFDFAIEFLVFPHLVDISLYDMCSNCITGFHTRFPSLRRLHLVTASTSYECWLNLAHMAPYITHLRLSDVAEDAYISPFLRILLDIPPTKENAGTSSGDSFPPSSRAAQQAVSVASRLSCLGHLIVQPGPCRSAGWRSNGAISQCDAQMESDLRSLASAAARGEGVGTLALLSPQKSYGPDDARGDWLGVVLGSDGPWSRSSRSEASGGYASPSVRARWPGGSLYFSLPDTPHATQLPDDTGELQTPNSVAIIQASLPRSRSRSPTDLTPVRESCRKQLATSPERTNPPPSRSPTLSAARESSPVTASRRRVSPSIVQLRALPRFLDRFTRTANRILHRFHGRRVPPNPQPS